MMHSIISHARNSVRHTTLSRAISTRIDIICGSFDRETSMEDAEMIHELGRSLTKKNTDGPTITLNDVTPGDEFDFNSLSQTSHLVISTSSCFGYAPANLSQFTHQLLLASETNPGCLSHLRHAVWGNGDERWFDTYMNVPRVLDVLLENAGSRRFYARGERGEPHAPTGASEVMVEDWAMGMWNSLETNVNANDSKDADVAWDALWEYEPSRRHDRMTQWTLEDLVTKDGVLDGPPSEFARPDEGYWKLLEDLKRAEERQRLLLAERRAAAAARRR